MDSQKLGQPFSIKFNLKANDQEGLAGMNLDVTCATWTGLIDETMQVKISVVRHSLSNFVEGRVLPVTARPYKGSYTYFDGENKPALLSPYKLVVAVKPLGFSDPKVIENIALYVLIDHAIYKGINLGDESVALYTDWQECGGNDSDVVLALYINEANPELLDEMKIVFVDIHTQYGTLEEVFSKAVSV